MRSFFASLVALSFVGIACGAPATVDVATPTPDGGAEGGRIVSFETAPLALIPSFSPSIHDYYVRCNTGDNMVTLTVTDDTGSETSTVDLIEDQAIVVGDDWVRCLPHDFPVITVATHAGGPTPGYYLVNSATYAVVLDTNGTPVWYARGTSPINVDALEPDVITFVPNSTAPYGYSDATDVAIHSLDTLTTTTITTVGSPTDAHEDRRLANGDRLLFTYPIEGDVDLTTLESFGDDENMADCEIQEVDPNGNLVWSWLASDHVDPTRESIEPAVNTINEMSVVDVFHCNAIDVDSNGNLLVSMRHANAVFYIDRASGMVVWKLGGSAFNKDGATHIDVTSDPETAFDMQHDARFRANGDITLFDDHGASPGLARGVEYAIDHTTNTAGVVFQFLGTAQSQYEGSFRRYDDGESVIGWGSVVGDPRVVTELDATGTDVLDIAFTGAASYRAIKVPLAQLDIDVLRTTCAK